MDQVGEARAALDAAEAAVADAQERARQLVADARAKVDEARAELAKRIVDEYQEGARVGDLARRADYNRETIRRILRGAGIEPD